MPNMSLEASREVKLKALGWDTTVDYIEEPDTFTPETMPEEPPEQESDDRRTAVFYDQHTRWIIGKPVEVTQ